MYILKKFSLSIFLLLTLNVLTTLAKSIDTAQASLQASAKDVGSNLIVPFTGTKADNDDGEDDGLSTMDWVWIIIGCVVAMIVLSCLVAYLFCECVKTIICLPCTCLKKCLC
ncbi:unnamed protein product [Orchesella dallaii]|uniref:Uncharacterized protein n=1 Tax=Orchesella dallaii TaxID=48710 RepID=A0ABP1RD92_9HEXA